MVDTILNCYRIPFSIQCFRCNRGDDGGSVGEEGESFSIKCFRFSEGDGGNSGGKKRRPLTVELGKGGHVKLVGGLP